MKHLTTTVRRLRSSIDGWKRVAGKTWTAALLSVLWSGTVLAQQPTLHPLHAGALPPGAIGRQRLLRGGPLSNYTQPTELRVPPGVEVGLASDGQFSQPEPGNPLVGLQVGHVYRFRVANIFDHPGVELFPTVELIDRLYPPAGEELRFPVPIELTAEELDMAARGMFVTRVIYVEDPQQALPGEQTTEQPWFEAGEGEDPLQVADTLGRPIAILRLGGREFRSAAVDPSATYGCPPLIEYHRTPSQLNEPTVAPVEIRGE